MKNTLLSLLLPAVLASFALASQAQTNADKPITLVVSKAPVQEALKTLFADAGISDPIVAPEVRGTVTLDLEGVPFSLALKQVLGAVSPPLSADILDGTYHIHLLASGPTVSQPSLPLPESLPSDDSDQRNFYKIGIRHYDAGVIADALTQPTGIIRLPPNFVIPANASVPGFPPAPGTAGSGGAANSGIAAPTGNTANGQQTRSQNVLPPGVKRIFVLESDNSLVVDATSQGFDNLTGGGRLLGGYIQVY